MSIHDVNMDAISSGFIGLETCSPKRAKSAERIEGASFTTRLRNSLVVFSSFIIPGRARSLA
jgi:hypothetical protein